MYLDNVAKLCRLCCQDCGCGYFDIFTESDEKASLVILINKYLPIKVKEDDKLPKHICETCHIGVATTVDLIDRMVEGQHHLRVLCEEYYKELHKSSQISTQDHMLEKNTGTSDSSFKNVDKKDCLRNKPFQNSNTTFLTDLDGYSFLPLKCDARNLDKSIFEIGEKKLKNLEKLGVDQEMSTITKMKIEDGPTAQVLIDIQGRNPDVEMNDLAKGMNVKKVYESHHLCLAMEGVQKKKRGRRRKLDSCSKYEAINSSNDKPCEKLEETSVDSIASNRPKRNKNIPTRYRDSLDEMEFEETVIQDYNVESDANDLKNQIEKHNIEFSEFNFHSNKQVEKTHILEDSTVIVTSNHQDETLLNLPAAVNIELDFNERSLITKDSDGNSISSIDHTPKASIQAIEIVPKVEFFPPVSSITANKDLHVRRKMSLLNVRRRKMLKKKKKFSCEYCFKTFVHEGRYIYHLKLHNSVILICETCNEEFAQNDELISHQKSSGHSGIGLLENEICDENKVLKCSLCPDRKFFCSSRYENHLKRIHGGKKPYPCPNCSKSYVSEHSRNVHFNVCHQTNRIQKLPCQECGKVFSLQSSLTYHIDSCHNRKRKFVCKICGKAFRHKQLLQRHFYVHTEDRPHSCHICNKSFKTKGNLDNHINLHTNSKVYTCELCGRQFNHLTSFSQHKRLHTGERPYKCSYCGKCFSQTGNHQEHLRIHTGEKPYCCPECGKNFTTSSQMKLHQRIHKKDHKFRCSYCPKGFFQQDMWLSHEAKHLGEKRQFKCALCEKSFVDKITYQRHMKTHMLTLCPINDKKTYERGVCSKQLVTSSSYTKHTMKHSDLKSNIPSGLTENDVPPSISSNPDVIYVLTKKDNNELEYITFENEIFTSSQSQTLVESLTAPGTSISQLPSRFICDGTSMVSTSVSQLEEESGNANFEIRVKDSMFM